MRTVRNAWPEEGRENFVYSRAVIAFAAGTATADARATPLRTAPTIAASSAWVTAVRRNPRRVCFMLTDTLINSSKGHEDVTARRWNRLIRCLVNPG